MENVMQMNLEFPSNHSILQGVVSNRSYSRKVILHLCADLGSDSLFYQKSGEYNVIMVGKKVGVENYHPPKNVHGIIANPICTEFSTLKGFGHVGNLEKGMFLVNHCMRIIKEANPKWWCLENPFHGRLKEILGEPKYVYQPWEFGSPWTKKTALWGNFTNPQPTFNKWEDVPKLDLYVRPNRQKPCIAYFHRYEALKIPEMKWAWDRLKSDADIRSMCSAGFASAFFQNNR